MLKAADVNAACPTRTGSDLICIDAASKVDGEDEDAIRTSGDVKNIQDSEKVAGGSEIDKLDARMEKKEEEEKEEDIGSDDDLLPLKCIYSFLLPWLLDVEKDRDARKQEKVLRMDAILDMTVSVLLTVQEENRILVVDAVCLKAETLQLLHLTISKVNLGPVS